MGLGIYNTERVALADLDDTVTTAHNGVTGESVDVLLYLRNDDPGLYYSDINISTLDSEGEDDTLGVYGTGRGFKLVAGARQPTEIEWDNVLAGDVITMSDIGTTDLADTTTYYPFWVRVIVPGNTACQTFSDVSLVIQVSEHVLGA